MNRCILTYHIQGMHSEDKWFETFADAYRFVKDESWAWDSWSIHHIGKCLRMAYSH